MTLQNVSITTGKLGETIITQVIDTPFYLNIWFGVSVLVAIAFIVLILYTWFRISLRNRTNVIIHMPDKTRIVKAYKHFSGTEFQIQGFEKTADGMNKKHTYLFNPSCVETGYFGKYIEYDYGVPYPRSFDKQKIPLVEEYKLLSAVMDTKLHVDLLLSSDFKNFVKMMLLFVLIVGIISIIVVIAMPFVYNPQTSCELVPTNQTLATIRQAIMNGK